MANYSLKLTPELTNLGTEGGLDTSVVNGVSLQRTVNVFDIIDDSGNRKQISVLKDGDSFNDTIENISSDNDSDI